MGKSELSFVNFSSDRKGFTVVILRTALPAFEAAFGAELEQLRGQDVVVEGTVSAHKEAPQIILADPAQIRLVERP